MTGGGAAPDVEALADDWAGEKTRVDQVVVLSLEPDVPAPGASSQRFVSGNACAPLTVGRAGQLRIDGARVLDVHAFVHFDGTSVFVCSTDATNPVWIGDRALPRRWTAVAVGSKLRIGDALVALRARTESAGAAAPAETAPARTDPGEDTVVLSPAIDDDTRVESPRSLPAAPRAMESSVIVMTDAQPPPAPPLEERPQSIASEAPKGEAPKTPTTETTNPAGVSTAVARRAVSRRERRRFVVVGAVAVLITWTLMAGGFVWHRLHRAASVRTPSPAAPVPAASLAVQQAAETPPATGVVVHPAPVRPPALQAPGRHPPTTERLAADAVRDGDLSRALTLYEQLASEQPDNPAFARAAAILRARVFPKQASP